MTNDRHIWGEAGMCRVEVRHPRMMPGRPHFKKDSAPAPAPDPMIGQAAAQNIELGKEALAFQKQQYADSSTRQDAYDALTNKVTQSAMDSQAKSDAWAEEDRKTQSDYRTKYDAWADADRQTGQDTLAKDQALAADSLASGKAYESKFNAQADAQNALAASQTGRYQQTFAPVEDKVASDAMNWDSAGRQEQMAAEAKGDATDAATRGAQANQRAMMSMGVNPNSGRFATTASADSTAAALAGAGAQNAARNNVRMQGVQLRQQAAQLGQQVLGSGQQAASLGMQATGAAQTARSTGVATAMQAQNQGLAAAGVGNTTASLGLGQQGAGYTGLGVGLQAGSAATSAAAGANAYDASRAGAMMGGFQTSGSLNTAGGQLANSLYSNQLDAWKTEQAASASKSSSMMSGIGTVAMAGAMAF